MKIYIRNDLNMRKGKISAQSAHAALGFWLSLMDNFTLSNESYLLFKQWEKDEFPIDIIPVDSEDVLLQKYSKYEQSSILIKDHGRTEFAGIPTNTCFATYGESKVIVEKYNPSQENIDKSYNTKQSFIVNKDIKLNKWDLAEHISRVCVQTIFKDYIETEKTIKLNILNDNQRNWLNGAFAKIVLQANTEQLNSIAVKLNNKHILHDSYGLGSTPLCICIGGDLIENINAFTQDLKLF